jgi:hypothetical protein
MPKNHIFSNFRGGGAPGVSPPGSAPTVEPCIKPENEGNVFVLGGSDFPSYYDFVLFDFGTVPTAWYFF